MRSVCARVGRVAITCALLFLPGLVRAQGKVIGTITDGTGQPVADVKVQLLPDKSDLSVLDAKTKKNGTYMFGLVRPGAYRLVAFKDGMRISRIDVDEVEPPEKKPVWSAHSDVPPGTSLPNFDVKSMSELTYDLRMTPSMTGPGAHGTGEPLVAMDAILKLVNEGQFDKAELEIRRNLAEKPDSAPYTYLDAYTLFSQSRNDEALAAVDKAIALEPSFEGSNLLRGKILEKAGKLEEAAASFRAETAVAKTQTGQRDAWLALAVAEERLGRKEPAIAALEKVVEVAPETTDAYYELANLYMQTSQMDKAKAINERLKQQGQTEDPNILYNLGAERFNKGDFKAAADFFDKAVRVKPDFADAHLQLGYTRINLGDLKAAAESLETYLKLKPEGEDAKSVRELLPKLRK